MVRRTNKRCIKPGTHRKLNIVILTVLMGRHMITESARPTLASSAFFSHLSTPCYSPPSLWPVICHLPLQPPDAVLLSQSLSLTKPFHFQTPKYLLKLGADLTLAGSRGCRRPWPAESDPRLGPQQPASGRGSLLGHCPHLPWLVLVPKHTLIPGHPADCQLQAPRVHRSVLGPCADRQWAWEARTSNPRSSSSLLPRDLCCL